MLDFLKLEFLKTVKSPKHRLAWLVAIVTDALQIGAFPFFAEGGLSPADDVVDVVTAAILCRLLGWHWVFLPTFAAELIPGVDLVPTWTAAVFIVTRSQVAEVNASTSNTAPSADRIPDNRPKEPEILPPGPAPARRP